jgi:hypothetical protein
VPTILSVESPFYEDVPILNGLGGGKHFVRGLDPDCIPKKRFLPVLAVQVQSITFEFESQESRDLDHLAMPGSGVTVFGANPVKLAAIS